MLFRSIVHRIKEWVDVEYDTGRVTVITDDELQKIISEAEQELGIRFMDN